MAVTVSMASCSLEEVVEQPTPQAIGFSSFVGKPTKAATEIVGVGGTSGLTKFYVFGKYGDATATYDVEVFNNSEVAVNALNTPSTPTGEQKYWVANKKYMFAAYSDGNNQLTTGVSFDQSGHITITGYTAGNNDLILAAPNEITTDATISSQPDAVELEFKHLLSQVAFEFKNGFNNGYQVKITGLQFSVPNTATYSFQTSTYKWDTPNTSANKEYTVNSDAAFDNSETKQSEYNFVIPQNNSSINASFTVTVYDTDGSTVVATKNYTDGNVVSLATGTTTNPAEGSDVWTPGYKYKYTATINADILDDVLFPIQFTVTSVDTWKNSTADGDFGLNLNN